MTEDKEKKTGTRDKYIGAGLAIGVGIGAAMDNIGVGIAIGIAIGAAMGTAAQKKEDNESED